MSDLTSNVQFLQKIEINYPTLKNHRKHSAKNGYNIKMYPLSIYFVRLCSYDIILKKNQEV